MGHGNYIPRSACWPHLMLLQPVYTDAYLYDDESLKVVERFREDIFTIIGTKESLMPPRWELVLEDRKSVV